MFFHVAFHDAEPVAGFKTPSKIVFMRPAHARAIWKFVGRHKDAIGSIVCHCEQGMSRSPAVALALAEPSAVVRSTFAPTINPISTFTTSCGQLPTLVPAGTTRNLRRQVAEDMTDRPDIDDLLLLWEDSLAQGKELSPEELCPDWLALLPEIRQRIQALKAMRWMEEEGEQETAHQPGNRRSPWGVTVWTNESAQAALARCGRHTTLTWHVTSRSRYRVPTGRVPETWMPFWPRPEGGQSPPSRHCSRLRRGPERWAVVHRLRVR